MSIFSRIYSYFFGVRVPGFYEKLNSKNEIPEVIKDLASSYVSKYPKLLTPNIYQNTWEYLLQRNIGSSIEITNSSLQRIVAAAEKDGDDELSLLMNYFLILQAQNATDATLALNNILKKFTLNYKSSNANDYLKFSCHFGFLIKIIELAKNKNPMLTDWNVSAQAKSIHVFYDHYSNFLEKQGFDTDKKKQQFMAMLETKCEVSSHIFREEVDLYIVNKILLLSYQYKLKIEKSSVGKFFERAKSFKNTLLRLSTSNKEATKELYEQLIAVNASCNEFFKAATIMKDKSKSIHNSMIFDLYLAGIKSAYQTDVVDSTNPAIATAFQYIIEYLFELENSRKNIESRIAYVKAINKLGEIAVQHPGSLIAAEFRRHTTSKSKSSESFTNDLLLLNDSDPSLCLYSNQLSSSVYYESLASLTRVDRFNNQMRLAKEYLNLFQIYKNNKVKDSLVEKNILHQVKLLIMTCRAGHHEVSAYREIEEDPQKKLQITENITRAKERFKEILQSCGDNNKLKTKILNALQSEFTTRSMPPDDPILEIILDLLREQDPSAYLELVMRRSTKSLYDADFLEPKSTEKHTAEVYKKIWERVVEIHQNPVFLKNVPEYLKRMAIDLWNNLIRNPSLGENYLALAKFYWDHPNCMPGAYEIANNLLIWINGDPHPFLYKPSCSTKAEALILSAKIQRASGKHGFKDKEKCSNLSKESLYLEMATAILSLELPQSKDAENARNMLLETYEKMESQQRSTAHKSLQENINLLLSIEVIPNKTNHLPPGNLHFKHLQLNKAGLTPENPVVLWNMAYRFYLAGYSHPARGLCEVLIKTEFTNSEAVQNAKILLESLSVIKNDPPLSESYNDLANIANDVISFYQTRRVKDLWNKRTFEISDAELDVIKKLEENYSSSSEAKKYSILINNLQATRLNIYSHKETISTISDIDRQEKFEIYLKRTKVFLDKKFIIDEDIDQAKLFLNECTNILAFHHGRDPEALQSTFMAEINAALQKKLSPLVSQSFHKKLNDFRNLLSKFKNDPQITDYEIDQLPDLYQEISQVLSSCLNTLEWFKNIYEKGEYFFEKNSTYAKYYYDLYISINSFGKKYLDTELTNVNIRELDRTKLNVWETRGFNIKNSLLGLVRSFYQNKQDEKISHFCGKISEFYTAQYLDNPNAKTLKALKNFSNAMNDKSSVLYCEKFAENLTSKKEPAERLHEIYHIDTDIDISHEHPEKLFNLSGLTVAQLEEVSGNPNSMSHWMAADLLYLIKSRRKSSKDAYDDLQSIDTPAMIKFIDELLDEYLKNREQKTLKNIKIINKILLNHIRRLIHHDATKLYYFDLITLLLKLNGPTVLGANQEVITAIQLLNHIEIKRQKSQDSQKSQKPQEKLVLKPPIYTSSLIEELLHDDRIITTSSLRYFLSLTELKIGSQQDVIKPQLEFDTIDSPLELYESILSREDISYRKTNKSLLALAYYEKVLQGHAHGQIHSPHQLKDLYVLTKSPTIAYATKAKELISNYFNLMLKSDINLEANVYREISQIWIKSLNKLSLSKEELSKLKQFFETNTKIIEKDKKSFHQFKLAIHKTVTEIAKLESSLKNLSVYYSFFNKQTKMELTQKVNGLKETLNSIMIDYHHQFSAGDAWLKRDFLEEIYPPTSRDHHILKDAIEHYCNKVNNIPAALQPH